MGLNVMVVAALLQIRFHLVRYSVRTRAFGFHELRMLELPVVGAAGSGASRPRANPVLGSGVGLDRVRGTCRTNELPRAFFWPVVSS
jgi:hypothetical protein